MPSDTSAQARQYARVARAIAFIRENAARQPSLEEIAAAVHLSPWPLQRIYSESAGISPKRFLQYLTKEFAKGQLAASRDLLTVAEDTGLSSTSRLHDLMVSCEAMTPGEIRHAGAGLEIAYGFAPTPFGDAIIAWTRGYSAISAPPRKTPRSVLFCAHRSRASTLDPERPATPTLTSTPR